MVENINIIIISYINRTLTIFVLKSDYQAVRTLYVAWAITCCKIELTDQININTAAIVQVTLSATLQ